jgi:hypothetical protein
MAQLKALASVKEPTHYEHNLYAQYLSWGKRLKVALEAAIIKMTINLR